MWPDRSSDDDEESDSYHSSGVTELSQRLGTKAWTGETESDGETARIVATDVPDLRDVYEEIDRAAVETGTVVGESGTQTWEVTVEDSEISGVERTDGEYTIRRMSRIERIVRGFMMLGIYTVFASVITVLLLGVNWIPFLGFQTPIGFWQSVYAFAGGSVLAIVAGILFAIVPGMSHGPREGDPGEGVPGFEELSELHQAALIAVDDAKSLRNEDAILERNRLPTVLASTAFLVYLVYLVFLNFGGVGVLVIGILSAIKALFGVAVAFGLLSALDEQDNERAHRALDEIHDASEMEKKPSLQSIGRSSNPVHENIPMAIPRTHSIIIPDADAQRLHYDELKAVIAHEYKHVMSHAPALIALMRAFTLVLPGIALVVAGFSGVQVTTVQFIGGLYVYLLVINALFAGMVRRWERQADAFAADVAEPIDLAHALNRLTSKHVVDTDDQTVLYGDVSQMYNSHPMVHKRVVNLVQQEVEE